MPDGEAHAPNATNGDTPPGEARRAALGQEGGAGRLPTRLASRLCRAALELCGAFRDPLFVGDQAPEWFGAFRAADSTGVLELAQEVEDLPVAGV